MPKAFFARDTTRVARALLGCVLETSVGGCRTAGRIVEVEAYVGPHDPAAHGFGNHRTKRNDALFGVPGTMYVYRIYGAHWCVNAVTEREEYPAAVLLRALEPLVGLDTMRERRKRAADRDLCSGPGKLCEALGITGGLDGVPSRGPMLRLRERTGYVRKINVGPRIGISRAEDWPLRFVIAGSPWTSRPRQDR